MRSLQVLKDEREAREAKRRMAVEEAARRERARMAAASKGKGARSTSTPEITPDAMKIEGIISDKGCYGKVYRGRCFQKEVAIKVPHVQNLKPNQLSDLRREVEIMSANPHPNICLFMGACTVPGQFRIVTELLHGDVEDLLKTKQHLGLYMRMKLAKDAALGMNWLHNSNPSIIHRDLKTSNLLLEKVGGGYRVKVADFGLSAIKPKTQKWLKDDKNGAKGTPLYMPPEVMMGEEFNEKADVYSFGIVLWEMLTRDEPFPHHTDYDEFVDSICEKNERPPLPKRCLPCLRVLLEACWHPDPAKRPDFEEVNDQLDGVLIHAAIADEHGRQFWQRFFLTKENVPWDSFYKAFYKFCELDIPDFEEISPAMNYISPYIDATAGSGGGLAILGESEGADAHEEDFALSEGAVQLLCLESLLNTRDKSGKGWVNVERFGGFLSWFGPMMRPTVPGYCMLEGVASLLSHEWFHGAVESGEAQRRLAGHDVGTFLVRFSTNPLHPGCYTISRVSGHRKVSHIRIGHSPLEGFNVNNTHHYPTLEQLILHLETPLALNMPCPGSQYQKLFLGGDLAGYQSVVSS